MSVRLSALLTREHCGLGSEPQFGTLIMRAHQAFPETAVIRHIKCNSSCTITAIYCETARKRSGFFRAVSYMLAGTPPWSITTGNHVFVPIKLAAG